MAPDASQLPVPDKSACDAAPADEEGRGRVAMRDAGAPGRLGAGRVGSEGGLDGASALRCILQQATEKRPNPAAPREAQDKDYEAEPRNLSDGGLHVRVALAEWQRRCRQTAARVPQAADELQQRRLQG